MVYQHIPVHFEHFTYYDEFSFIRKSVVNFPRFMQITGNVMNQNKIIPTTVHAPASNPTETCQVLPLTNN
jgi:hypothetical protein